MANARTELISGKFLAEGVIPKRWAMTPGEATERQIETWRRLSLEERFRVAAAMIEDGFALVAASIRAEHPE